MSSYFLHRLGPLLWISSLQYFVVQVVTAATWTTPFSLASNAISDLGNTACGQFGQRYVCSPLHGLMNVSFMLLGLTMILGSVLIGRLLAKNRVAVIGFGGMGLAGVGTLVVGIVPENTIHGLHLVGAAMPFLIGNIGLGLIGVSAGLPLALRSYSIITSIVTLSALGLLMTGSHLGLGFGGLERLTAYPQTIWLIVMGAYLLRYPRSLNGSSARTLEAK